ncbi:MAG: hypothetical protein BWK72_16235 [Rhodoferax ferrireducens]|uniref:Secretion system X translation initiation factor n=1 Tax=Rhodoferax ferrireducens TaxID=192843 RepID=A0A1W9KQV1_9BURK|nr:MAG: hypothetical protein BWK72_16235 [Rhodoferax ferrireducens]
MLPTRQILLALALVTTIAASFVDFSEPQELPEPQAQAKSVVAVKASEPQPPAQTASAPLRERFAAQALNVFEPRSWQPPPPPPPKAQAPSAPTLPFRYLGKVQNGDQIMVFLDQSARTHLVKKGDTLAGYKVEDITMANMTFVYLPLNEKQSLTFGSAN